MIPALHAQTPVEPDAELGGWRGTWLRTPHAEAFVASIPYPRIIAFQIPGGRSPLNPAFNKWSGIRTWFVEPVQTKDSYPPSERPARLLRLPDGGLLLEGGLPTADSTTPNQVLLEVRLDPDRPVLRLRHGVRNLAETTRRFNAWSIVVFPSRGTALVPWNAPDHAFRTLTLWPYTTWQDVQGSTQDHAFLYPFGRASVSPSMKVGITAPSGVAAYLDEDLGVVLHAPYAPGAPYPEGGGNVTIYHSCKEPGVDGVGEIEHVGPLTDVAPGGTVWLEQSLEIVPELAQSPGCPASTADILQRGAALR